MKTEELKGKEITYISPLGEKFHAFVAEIDSKKGITILNLETNSELFCMNVEEAKKLDERFYLKTVKGLAYVIKTLKKGDVLDCTAVHKHTKHNYNPLGFGIGQTCAFK